MGKVNELEKIDSEEGRKHFQKLVYTNLVDRFDYMVDQALIENWEQENLVSDASKWLDRPLTVAEFVNAVLNQVDFKKFAEHKVHEYLRSTILRDRHSMKVSKLCAVFSVKESWNEQRVNISTGQILKKITPQNKTTPYSICGYADWLYSRRNAIVHGGGNKFLKNDVEQIKKQFKCTIAKSVKIQLASIKVTGSFYLSLLELFLRNNE